MQVANYSVRMNHVHKPFSHTTAKDPLSLAAGNSDVRMQGASTRSFPQKLGILALALSPLTSLLSGCVPPSPAPLKNEVTYTAPAETNWPTDDAPQPVETPPVQNTAPTPAKSESIIDTSQPAKTLDGSVDKYWRFASGSIDSRGNVYNTFGIPQGSIDKKGNAYNVFGLKIGSCSDGGTIYGLIMPVGSITSDGTVSKTFSFFSLGKIDVPKLSRQEKGAAAYLLFHDEFNE